MSKKLASLVIALSVGVSVGLAEDGVTAGEALDKLKSLSGRWEGHVMSPDGPEGAVEYRVTAAGTTVVETMFPGTAHEMMTVYYIDGDDLRAKHFCDSGTQPEMKLDRAASSSSALVFAFTGGTNFDVATDAHIHGGMIGLKGDRLENSWPIYQGGKETASTRFYLSRASK